MRWVAIVVCVIAGQGCDPLEVCNPYLVYGMVVEITASGYRPWKRTGVEVKPDDSGCHVVEVQLDAGMVRLGT